MNKVFNISVPSKYKNKNTGAEQQKWNIVGKAFLQDNGQINLKIDNNISIANSVVLFPVDKQKD